MRIVIVEDDAVVSSTLSLYLTRAGYETVVARDGVRGLELASGKEVALLILDLMIPGIPGHEICKRLRQTSTLPIMMLTARTSEADQVAGFDLGADDYVSKPFRPREVVAQSTSPFTPNIAATYRTASTDCGRRSRDQLLEPQRPTTWRTCRTHADRIPPSRSVYEVLRTCIHARRITVSGFRPRLRRGRSHR